MRRTLTIAIAGVLLASGSAVPGTIQVVIDASDARIDIAGEAGTLSVGPTPGLWTEPVTLVEVNTETAEEWSPTLSPDGLTLYFGRVNSPESSWGRVFQATRLSPFSHFTSVAKLPGPLNDLNGHVHGQWVSLDQLRLYYAWQPNGVFRLRVSERLSTSGPWPEGRDIAELNLLGDRLHAPRLTPDERTIFLAGPEGDGRGDSYDIWMATRPDLYAPFSQPINVETLNSPFNDIHAFPADEGLELYFASDRNGHFQLFKATRPDADSPFGEPVLLSLFDTRDGNCRFPCLSADGTQFYFMRELAFNRSTRDICVSYRID